MCTCVCAWACVCVCSRVCARAHARACVRVRVRVRCLSVQNIAGRIIIISANWIELRGNFSDSLVSMDDIHCAKEAFISKQW